MRSPVPATPFFDNREACPAQAPADAPTDYRDSRNGPQERPDGHLRMPPPSYFFRSGPGPRPDARATERVTHQVTARRWSGCRRVHF